MGSQGLAQPVPAVLGASQPTEQASDELYLADRTLKQPLWTVTI